MSRLRYAATLLILVALILGALPSSPAKAQAPGPDEKTLVIAQSQDVQSLDPPQVGSRTDDNIVSHMFATLYEIDDFGNIVPFLAKDYRISEDGTEVTFVLNEGLTCHDGEPLTAEDVVYTFKRAADPANGFTGNTPGFVFASVAYKDARVDSELEATIILERYQSIALGLLSEVHIHCKDSYEKMSLEEAQSNPIGSGPYKFVEWVKDDYLLMEKWDEFKLRDPYFDRIVWRVIPEASTRTAELIAGNVDIITNVPPDQHQAVNNSGVASVVPVEGLRRIYVGFNFTDNFKTECADAIKKTEVRVALQYAVDVPTICEALLGVPCKRATGPVNAPNDHPDLQPYPYDPAKAEELLDAAGYPRKDNGVRFECTLMAGRNRYLNDVNVVQTICQYLDDIGVKTNCQLMDFRAEFIPLLVAQQAGELFFVGSGGGNWNALYEMADFASETSNPNYGFWSNPEWFNRWRSLSNIRDPQEERKVVLEMLEVFYNDPPWILLYMQPDFYGVNNRLDWQPRRDERVITFNAKLK
ncbi:MAG: ABC transporter substrate-binding protein [Anaerolineae bacterium]|nr:MAG: ABC transporter substrate-binding protein [Anaerolineae bacterium]